MLTFSSLRLVQGDFTLELDLSLGKGVTGLFGPSGSGKTSLLELVAGLRRPQAGTLSWADERLAEPKAGHFVAPEVRQFGYVPQDGALFPHLSVEGNLRYGRRPSAPPPGLGESEVCDLLDLTGLRHRLPAGLSGGEKQRVAVGRALLAGARLLLLDEPFAHLDSARKGALLPYLGRLREETGLPMLLVSHQPADLEALCDEVVVLHQGTVVQRGAFPALFAADPAVSWQLKTPLAKAGPLPRLSAQR